MIGSASPRFKSPLPGWQIARIGEPPRPGGGTGTLELRVGHCAGLRTRTPAEAAELLQRREQAGDPVASEGDLRSSLVPLVLVDGRPAAAGWGSITIPLPAGRHLVEVQSQHSRAWRAVDIEAGKTAKLDYIGMLGDRHRSYAEGPVSGPAAELSGHALGPRGRLHYRQYLPAHARSRLSFGVFLLSLCAAAPVTWLTALTGADAAVVFSTVLALPLLGLAFWGARILWTYLRYNRIGPDLPLSTAAFVPSGLVAPVVLAPDGPPLPPHTGGAAVLIDARFLKADLAPFELARQLPPGQTRADAAQRKALDRVGELVPVRHRPAVPPPEIWLDGIRIAASWTRMWIETGPGRHRLSVRTPGAPLPVPSGQAPPRTGVLEIDAVAGRTVSIDLAVTVKAVPDPSEPLLHQWDCRITRFAAEAEPPPEAAPVVGGRRTAPARRWSRSGR